ncbi:PH domain-containing protein [Chryseolinea lacunae]|uniref:PH domain-containing protein n=1 Tax=Chryseolinea lacunae TaxID=2801331 RepID=A0ABS1KPP6_9BACT|nr:PH domain-containing protein [Chryseolinea lacunae]MBL0741420.1 PH domain-containing protein [Chryseolinea lacunae]
MKQKISLYGLPLLMIGAATWGFTSNVLPPLVCGFIVLFAIFAFIQEYRDQKSDQEFANISALDLPVRESLTLKPDREIIILKGWMLPSFAVALGIFLNYPLNLNDINIIGAICFVIGPYLLYHLAFVQDKVYYTLDSLGVHITRPLLFSAPVTKVIPYGSITAVLFTQSFFEARKNIGTICIAHEHSDTDDEYYACKLVGVAKYKEIAKLILDRANHVATKQADPLQQ